MNTPQFDWCQTTLDKHPQPVPPIYQPEVPARAIVDVALDGRREKVVGSWNKMLIFVDSLFRGVGNNYAAIAAWDSQLTNLEVKPGRPSNLHEPADRGGDFGAHGIFDDQAGGVVDPSFLQGLPQTARLFAKAVVANLSDNARTRTRMLNDRQPLGRVS